MKKQFREAREHLNEVTRVKEREERRLASPVDQWITGNALTHEALDHLRDLRLREREDLIPNDRVCPRCGITKLASRQWVILVEGVWEQRWRPILHSWVRAKERELSLAARQDREPTVPVNPFSAVCRSCHSIEPTDKPVEDFITLELWWTLDHKAVKRARYDLNLTGAEVATQCGWSQSRQSKVETRAVSVLSDNDVSRIQLALKLTVRPVVGEPVRRYILSGPALIVVRKHCGISRNGLASKMGVSASRIATLESKDTTRVELRVAESLISALRGISPREEG